MLGGDLVKTIVDFSTAAVLTVVNVRRTLIFRGEEYLHIDQAEKKRKPDWVTQQQWDAWNEEEKHFAHEVDLGVHRESQSPTLSDVYINNVRDIRFIGRAVAPVLNFVFSPTFLRIVGVVAAVSLLFTPFGYTVGAVAMGLSLASMGYELYRQVDKIRTVSRMQEERVLLSELEGIKKELQVLHSKNPGLFKRISHQGLFNIDKLDNKLQPSLLDSAVYVGKGRFASVGVTLGLSIATLSPVPILLSFLNAATGYSNGVKTEYEFDKRIVYLHNLNAYSKANLGLDSGSKPGQDVESLRLYLADLRAYKHAMETTMSSGKPSKDMVLKEFEKEPIIVAKPVTPSFLSDTLKVLGDGVSWTKFGRLLTPSFVQAAHVSAYSNDTYEKARSEAIAKGKAKEPEIERAPEPLHGPDYWKNIASKGEGKGLGMQ